MKEMNLKAMRKVQSYRSLFDAFKQMKGSAVIEDARGPEFQEGMNAAAAGASEKDCPYSTDDPKAGLFWLSGYRRFVYAMRQTQHSNTHNSRGGQAECTH